MIGKKKAFIKSSKRHSFQGWLVNPHTELTFMPFSPPLQLSQVPYYFLMLILSSSSRWIKQFILVFTTWKLTFVLQEHLQLLSKPTCSSYISAEPSQHKENQFVSSITSSMYEVVHKQRVKASNCSLCMGFKCWAYLCHYQSTMLISLTPSWSDNIDNRDLSWYQEWSPA